MKAVAKQFPKTHFAIVDVSNADEGGLKNVAGPPLQGAGGRLPRRLRGGARREGSAAGTRSRPSAAQKQPPVDRYIAGFQAGAKAAVPRRQDAERLLAGLREPGEVQGGRAEPDRRRLGRRLPGRGRLRPRRARRGQGEGRLGRRRRRRPGLPRAVRPHLGAEARRHVGLRLDQGREGRASSRAARTRSTVWTSAASASASSRRRRPRASPRRSRRSSSRSRRARSRTSRRP